MGCSPKLGRRTRSSTWPRSIPRSSPPRSSWRRPSTTATRRRRWRSTRSSYTEIRSPERFDQARAHVSNDERTGGHPGSRVTSPALLLEHVTCTFASREREGERYTAVKDTTIAVGAGEFVSVVGPTGCGKSTLLNVAAGLLSPSSGGVRVLGEALSGINRRAGYMFQAESLMPWRRALGPRDRALGRACHAPDRRICNRSAAAARRQRDTAYAALRRAAPRDVAQDEERSSQGLCKKPQKLTASPAQEGPICARRADG